MVKKKKSAPQSLSPQQWFQVLNVRLARIEAKINAIQNGEVKTMATLDDIRTAVASETSTVAAVTTLLQSLSQQLKDALASEDPAAIQSLVDQINQNANVLANAVAANTPAPAPAPAT